jgi:hypothetical protein
LADLAVASQQIVGKPDSYALRAEAGKRQAAMGVVLEDKKGATTWRLAD